MGAGRRIRAAPDVVSQEVEGELVLLDLAAECYWSLDDIGTRCWQLLTEHGELDALIAAMLEEFDVDEATLRADAEALIEQLGSAGLIVVGEPDSST